MTTIQPTGGTSRMTVDSTDLTTDGQRNMQRRIEAFISEVNRLKAVITENSDAYMALLRDHEAEKEARTNAQNSVDVLAANISAMHVKLTAYRTLLQRVVDVDEACTGEAYAQLIADVKAALEVQS